MSAPVLRDFTRTIWRQYRHDSLEPLKRAVLERRKALAEYPDEFQGEKW
jgi:hypothetical protein